MLQRGWVKLIQREDLIEKIMFFAKILSKISEIVLGVPCYEISFLENTVRN